MMDVLYYASPIQIFLYLLCMTAFMLMALGVAGAIVWVVAKVFEKLFDLLRR